METREISTTITHKTIVMAEPDEEECWQGIRQVQGELGEKLKSSLLESPNKYRELGILLVNVFDGYWCARVQ